MAVDLDLLKKITHGAIKIAEMDGGYVFSRMTEWQGKVCLNTSQDYFYKPFSTAGIRLEFVTDAQSFRIKGEFRCGASRTYSYLDVKVNGVIVQHDGTENYIENPDFSMTVNLDGKKNKVAVYFPNMVQFALTELEFERASVIEPVKKDLTMVCWGDSITHGYDAIYPSLSYANQLADGLNAEMYNKAIGGEIFNPAYFDEVEPLKADLITIAYGTNDWNRYSEADLKRNARSFLEKITSIYSEAAIYLIVPIWRADNDRITAAGTFDNARSIIFDICRDFPMVNVIDGMELVPHEIGFFKDSYLHPNDLGFMFMAKKLLEYIKKP